MDQTRALEILTALRDGHDPEDGTPLPTEAPCQRPDVLRALYAACHALSPEAPGRQRPANAGKRWTPDDDARLAQGHDDGEPLSAVARELGRTGTSVRLRLVHLGRIDPDEAGVQARFVPAATSSTAD